MVSRASPKAIRWGQLLGATGSLALLAATFEMSSFRGPIFYQAYILNYLRGGRIRDTVDSPTARLDSDNSGGTAARADVSAGFHAGPVTVKLTQPNSLPIYYTLDGSLPTVKARRYVHPITIENTSVLRFAASPTGPVQTHTYIVNEPAALPVISLALDPAFLWNRHAGIYLHAQGRGPAWRRPANAEYFAGPSSPPARFPVELKIHGNWSRNAEKKSFQLSYAPARVSGPDRTAVVSLPGESAGQRTLVARAAAIDVSYRLGDELFRALFGGIGGLTVAATPVQLLLNGQAWGLYNVFEKITPAYLQRKYGEGEYDLVDDAGYRRAAADATWNRLLDFFAKQDLSRDQDFAQAALLIDIDNFTDYWLFNIYAGNYDWPQNNYYAFRNRSGDGRWRWISWDADSAFDINKGLRHETLTWATRSVLRDDLSYGGTEPDDDTWMASTVIIRGLLRNPQYRAGFLRRFCELRSRQFNPDFLDARFQRVLDRLTPHLATDWKRWPVSREAYETGAQGVRRFILERPAVVLRQFRQQFQFSGCPAN